MNLVNDKTLIDKGFQLSPNFLLDHMTTGAFHKVLGKWIPQFPMQLHPRLPNGIFTPGFPLLNVVRNLQIGSNNIMEGMLSNVGSDLLFRSGLMTYLPPGKLISEVGHKIGTAFDIGIAGFESNPFHFAKDIQMLARKASEVNMVFGNGVGYFHINFDPIKAADTAIKTELPVFKSVDLMTGETFPGIAAMRGYV